MPRHDPPVFKISFQRVQTRHDAVSPPTEAATAFEERVWNRPAAGDPELRAKRIIGYLAPGTPDDPLLRSQERECRHAREVRVMAGLKHPVTPDGRYFVVRGRLWRLANPDLSETLRSTLVSEPMKARSAVRSAKITGDPAGETA